MIFNQLTGAKMGFKPIQTATKLQHMTWTTHPTVTGYIINNNRNIYKTRFAALLYHSTGSVALHTVK